MKQSFDQSFKQPPLRAPDSDSPPAGGSAENVSMDEFYSAALDLAELSDAFFRSDKTLELFKHDLDGPAKELLGLYDEFFDILEAEVQMGTTARSSESGGNSSELGSLIRLQASIQCHREFIASLFAAIQRLPVSADSKLTATFAEQFTP